MTAITHMEPKLTVLKGGLKPKEEWRRYFLSAYITDTRLMGVMGMYIHWRAAFREQTADFHQFFYFDAEETGFETYLGLWSDDPFLVAATERENIGGLGGAKVNLTLSEAKQILRHYCVFNREHDLPLPPGGEDYLELLTDLPALSAEEEYWLLMKQCAPLRSDYALINYFLMRSFGKDLEAVSLLTHDGRREDVYPTIGIATLCRNVIHASQGTFLCDSLIEHDGQYEVVVTRIQLSDRKVASCQRTQTMQVSAEEAALILSRPEFITVYRVTAHADDEADLDSGTETFALDFDTVSDAYEYGRLFFSFYDNNEHVDRPTFLLSGDVYGVYYLTDFGQLLVMAYETENIRALEHKLENECLAGRLLLIDKYEFKEPVLYEFIQSGYEDFNEFVEAIDAEE